MTTVNGVTLGPNSPARRLRKCRTEDAEERLCDDLILRLGGSIVSFSQAQAAQQTRGISDRRYRLRGTAFWFELKAADGQLTASQHAFLLSELDCGCLASCGTLDNLVELVNAIATEQRRDVRGADGLAQRVCRETVAAWAAKGYRAERPTRRRRRG